MTGFKFKATHHGKFLGVPVWLDMRNDEAPAIKPKLGWFGECWMWVMETLFGWFIFVQTWVDPYYEPLFPITVGKAVTDDERVKRGEA